MNSNIKPHGYWTKEKCQEEAFKYQTRTEFRDNSASAYRIAIKKNWLNDICDHMSSNWKPAGYWTKSRCHQEALKYSTRNEFNTKSKNAYSASLRKKWLNDICSHFFSFHCLANSACAACKVNSELIVNDEFII